ncbi:MAG: response regulator transcription factor, partial [Spirochaetia bacterium]|nr:response regulator transcription factor [Spirochaetia bacterium]
EDYLRKPFSSMKILLARVSNILQRHDTEAPKITLGELELSPLNYSVIAAGETVDLSYSEFKILQLLMENPGVTYTREAIMTVIKAGKSSLEYEDTSRKKASALRSIDVQVLSLRKKLGKCGKYIQTVRSAGYMIQIEP